MKKLIIGTIHNMLPKHKIEFEKILEKINPSQILVEIVQSDLVTKKFRKYPKEMVFAYNWGVEKRIPVFGFDTRIEIGKKGVTKYQYRKILKKVQSLCEGFDWKRFNNKTYPNKKEIYITIMELIDIEKHIKREKQMLKNINKISKNSKVLILTGAMHLSFFEKSLKGCKFPLRKRRI